MSRVAFPLQFTQRFSCLNAGCARDAPGQADASNVERMRNLLDGMRPGTKLVLLAEGAPAAARSVPYPRVFDYHDTGPRAEGGSGREQQGAHREPDTHAPLENTPPPPIPDGVTPRNPVMLVRDTGDADVESSGLRDFSRTVAEIEWLLVILVLLYHVFQDSSEDNTVAIYAGLIAYSLVIIGLHTFQFLRKQDRPSLAIETWMMVAFITWVLYHTGRLDSPLLNLYLLPIVTSAVTVGQKFSLLQVGVIGACYLFLGYTTKASFVSMIAAGDFAASLGPMLLVAYIITMLSQDVNNAIGRIRLLSETDELTRAYNMRAFNSIARRECALARRHNRSFSLLMVDSDNLKKVNDTYGHEAGDQLIRLVAKCIRGDLRETDVVARYGGDEFMCLLPETEGKAAVIVADRVRQRVAATALRTAQGTVATSVSIGIAAYPEHGQDFETLAKHADRALYASKHQGRNRVTVYSKEG